MAKVVLNREKLTKTKTKGRLKLIACLKCKTERDGEMPEPVSNVDGLCWLCPGCFKEVEKGNEGMVLVKREEIAEIVASELVKQSEVILEKITEQLNLFGIGDIADRVADRLGLNRSGHSGLVSNCSGASGDISFAAGERSYAETVRRPSAKITIKNA